MSLLHTAEKMQIEKDIRYTLFNWYITFIGVLGLVFMIVNAINRRPLVNVLTGLIITLLCIFWYLTSKVYHRYTLARVSFQAFITFVYVPFGYWTSPGTESAMVYLILLSIFMLSFSAIHHLEYLFSLAIIFEALILFQTELWIPEHYYVYTDPAYRIFDLSINFTVVAVAIVGTIHYVYKRVNDHSNQLYEISITDGLTGLYNRRFFTDFIQAEYNRSTRNGYVFSMVIFDVNNFKKINDNYGHPEGDKVLKTIADIIKNNVRSYDIACRTGGDEFVLIMPDTDADTARSLVGRMDDHFRDLANKYTDVELSVAFGIEDSLNKNLETLYHIADKHLYQMKKDQKGQ